jgi:alcohol dehydrogenase (cytochrome c)
MTSKSDAGPERRIPVPQPGSDPNKLTGIGKINLSTGEILRFNEGRSPSNGAMLTTAGDLVFHGDMNRRFRAFDVYTGKQLWEGIVGGHVSVSTISYAAGGKQYIAIMTGDGLLDGSLLAETPELKPPRGSNAIFVFALPDKR